ncbi:TorF family putative porin [Cupriavidus sp. WKF15]|uniref:TorF family putative porin n=1 Tax=Cupriavidus sp. WKF15 TaxID=3032282 RepID=UPI0023E163FB|nr:TorF family putative porin [Cupriavidus sp. WKF15]WER48013.1 TorF family putative porin [Cupriavidus sp. WKF15]
MLCKRFAVRHKPCLAAATGALLLCQAVAAHAQSGSGETTVAAAPVPQVTATVPPEQAASPSPLSANMTLTSQYVSRGFRQTWGKPAVQGGVDYAHPSGWSAGTWMSTVSDKFIEGGTVEWDLYGGYTGTIGDFVYAGQIYYYLYPGAKLQSAQTKYNYGEAVASLTYKWLNIKYWLTYTPDYFGYNSASIGTGNDLHSRGSGYLDINGTFELGYGVSLLLHYGQERVRNFAAYGFRDVRVALSKAFDGGWTLTGAYTRGWGRSDVYDHYTTGALDSAGNPSVSNPLANTFLVSLTKTF